MDKRSVLVVSLLSLFLLFSFRGYAIEYNVNSTSPDNNTVYDPSATYYFNITWVNTTSDEHLTEVNFTLVRPNGLPIVYTLTTNPINISNNSSTLPSETWIAFTQDQLGPTGLYQFNWSASNGINVNNTFPITTYYINNASSPISLFLDGNEGNVNLDRYWTVNITAQTVSGLPIKISSSIPSWSPEPTGTTTVYNLTNLTNEGNYSITAYTEGNANYYNNSTTYYINVSEMPPQNLSISVNPSRGSQYDSNQNYQFNISWQDGSLKNVTLNMYNISVLDANPINITLNSVLNSTQLINYTINSNTKVFSINMSSLPAGIYNFNWTAFDISNHSSIIYTYVVNQKDISSNLILSPSMSLSSPLSVSSGTTVTVTCSATSYPVNLTISLVSFPSAVPITNNVNPVSIIASSLTQSTDVNCWVTQNNNYTGSTRGSIAVITPLPSPQPSGPGTSTGSFLIKDLISSLAMTAGETKTTSFTLSNTLGSNIEKVNISLTGIDSSWYSLSRNSIPLLKRNVPEIITITFKIPENAEAKEYYITATAKGKLISETSSRTTTATMKLNITSPQPIQPIAEPEPTVTSAAQENANMTSNITSNQTSGATGLAPAFEFFKNNLVIILAVAACLLIFIFRNNLTTVLTGTLGKEETKTHKAKSESPLSGLKNKFNYKLIVNLKKEGRTKNLKETEIQGTEMVPEKEPKRPAILENEIKRDIKELQSIIENEKKVKKNKKKFNLGNN